MNKVAKVLFAFVAAAMVGSAMAASLSSATVPFLSTGDTYADGTPVIDGEWYVLCWSARNTFAGLKPDLTPVAEGDRVVGKAPLAENGGCDATFVVNNPPTGGNYFMVMLDTRIAPDKLAAKVNGLPATVNGTGVAIAVALSDVKGGQWASTVTGSGTSTFDPVIGDNFKPAKISGISVEGDQAVITVSDMSLGAKYIVKSGSTLDNINTTGITEATAGSFANGGTADFTFVVDSDDARFFQVFQAK